MASYKHIAERVRHTDGWTPKTCWIAHCKKLAGLPVRRAPNRQGSGSARVEPCPQDRVRPILAAFKYFRMT